MGNQVPTFSMVSPVASTLLISLSPPLTSFLQSSSSSFVPSISHHETPFIPFNLKHHHPLIMNLIIGIKSLPHCVMINISRLGILLAASAMIRFNWGESCLALVPLSVCCNVWKIIFEYNPSLNLQCHVSWYKQRYDCHQNQNYESAREGDSVRGSNQWLMAWW